MKTNLIVYPKMLKKNNKYKGFIVINGEICECPGTIIRKEIHNKNGKNSVLYFFRTSWKKMIETILKEMNLAEIQYTFFINFSKKNDDTERYFDIMIESYNDNRYVDKFLNRFEKTKLWEKNVLPTMNAYLKNLKIS